MAIISRSKVLTYLFCGAVLAFILLGASGQAMAYTQTRGYFMGLKGDRITIELPQSQGKAYFWVNKSTIVVNVGLPMTLSRIPKHSVVEIKSEGNTAVEVLVEEVPK